jgi:L-iditol 2-dehydrogenase
MNVAELERVGSLRIKRKDLRPLRAGEVLVRVEACGVCGTDLHIVEGSSRATPPVVIGHEFSGHIEDGGRTGRKAGEHVGVDPNIACGVCSSCRRGLVHLCDRLRALGVDIDGGMAEQCIVPETQLYALPATMAADISAFVEPVSCALHGLDRAGIRSGDRVVILGGGTIGLVMLQLALRGGGTTVVVIEPHERKRGIALALGAAAALDPLAPESGDALRSLLPVGADVVLECSGNIAAVQMGLTLARRGGTLELFGVCPIGAMVSIEPNAIYQRELTIVGSYVNPHTFSRAIDVLSSGAVRIEPLLPDRFPLDAVHDALHRLRSGESLKCIVIPSEGT